MLYSGSAEAKVAEVLPISGTFINLPYQDVRNKYTNPQHLDCTDPALWTAKVAEMKKMGMDVHDMEDLGENYVGYGDERQRFPLLEMGHLRMARDLKPGHVITDELGIYFIPALIEQWKREGTDKGFVNHEKLAGYYDFGGIRLEDDVLVTAEGARRLGPYRLPIKSSDIEDIMANE